MQTLFSVFWAATILLLASQCGSSAATNIPLAFYVVSDKMIEGGRLIDTPDFPKLGYIPAVPALVLTKLESVTSDVMSEKHIVVDKNEKETVVSKKKRSGLNIQMHPDDAKRFAAITERAVGKRVLVMLGDTPLTAPRVMGPISTPSMLLTFGEKTDARKIEADLRKLTN